MDRAKQLYLSHYRAMPKSLERATAHRLMRAMFNGEERFIEPSPQAIGKLTLPVVRDAVMKQLVPSNMEVCLPCPGTCRLIIGLELFELLIGLTFWIRCQVIDYFVFVYCGYFC